MAVAMKYSLIKPVGERCLKAVPVHRLQVVKQEAESQVQLPVSQVHLRIRCKDARIEMKAVQPAA
jgi:hypothetical protein